MSTATTPRHRKALVPLATLLAASALVVGSGATFTSQSDNTVSSVTSGTLSHSNSKDNAALFDLTGLKPGDSLTGGLELTNTGDLPAAFSLTEASSSNGFSDDMLSLTITNVTSKTSVYTGAFGGLEDGVKNELGRLAPGRTAAYRFTVTLDQDATNTEQGKSATAAYEWDAVQLDGQTTNQ